MRNESRAPGVIAQFTKGQMQDILVLVYVPGQNHIQFEDFSVRISVPTSHLMWLLASLYSSNVMPRYLPGTGLFLIQMTASREYINGTEHDSR